MTMNPIVWNHIRLYRTASIALVLFFALAILPAAADMMFLSDPARSGDFGTSGNVPANTVLWKFTSTKGVASSPVVVNGVVYIGGGDNNTYAFDAVTGKELWRFVTGDAVVSSPAVVNGVVYIGSMDNNLYAVNA
ncbi:MAG: PQQ-binding-like beta-propeller repeat protein, partial [Methanoregula sp.]|nr:PQQ-binding-like beta-propeller repeat protein [Methanoregula sp.]